MGWWFGAAAETEQVMVHPARDSPAPDVFVGRGHALAELEAAIDAAVAGQGVLALVTGDPGIGKTQLASEVAARARARGVLVLRGACWEGGGAPAYWPWTQVLRDWMRTADDASLDALEARVTDLAALVPELAPGAHAEAESQDAEGDRLRLFDALTDTLLRGAERQPMLILLDDLHWADRSSVLALRFLAGELHRGRLLVVGAYRDVEVGDHHPLAAGSRELASVARRLPLSGLTTDEVARFIATITGVEPEPRVVDAVSRHTGGNPLFVRELVRLAWKEGAVGALAGLSSATQVMPGGVREVIAHRLGLLEADVQSALEVASVVGEAFTVEVVARTTELDRRATLAALEQAVDARLVAADAAAPGHYRFAHALIRDVLYQSLPAQRQTELHGQVGEAIEELSVASEEQLTAIASHYLRAAPLTGGERAVRYAQRAGERAMAMLGWEEAAGLFEQALGVLDLAPGAGDAGQHADLHLSLGQARLRAGHTDAARQAFLAAADLARACDEAERLAAAALGLGGASPVWGIDPELVEQLEQARAALGEHGDPALRARLLARLAQAQYYLVTDAERDALSREAVEVARASSDDRALVDALTARRVLWGPEDLSGRAEVSEELVGVAQRVDDLELDVRTRVWRVVDLVEAGDLAAARTEIQHHATLAARLREPSHLRDGAVWRAMVALLDGRFAEAEERADEALAAGDRIQAPGAGDIYRVQKPMILAEQADPEQLDEAVRLAREGSDAHPDIPAWRALLAFTEARADRHEDARADLEAAAGDGFAGVPRDAVFLVALTHAADAAAIIGHRELAAILRRLLEPYADRWVVIDRGLACKGSTERLIGLLDGVLGDVESSVERLDRALTRHVRTGAHAFAARTRRELAAALLARRHPGDAERAAGLLGEAETEAHRLGMPGLLAEIVRHRSGVEAHASPTPAAETTGAFQREGDFWALSFAGRTIRLRETKGLRDLAALLAQPHGEIAALDLMGAGGAAVGRGETDIEVLDPQARRAYRARLTELQDEFDEAEANQDVERAARARQEMDVLAEELAGAVGLGGRPRREPGPAERARKAVTWRIRNAIERIEQEHPELGRHLRHSIVTGTYCSYAPEHPVSWQVQGAA